MILNPISYPGNKNKLLKELIPLFPSEIDTFVDVFCGSGVVGVNSVAKNIHCNDNNPYTIEVLKYLYNNNFDTIIQHLEKIIVDYNLTYSRIQPKGTYTEYRHEGLSLYNKEGYNRLKADYNSLHTTDKLLVLLIYGFNHYLRFNSHGQFNVPVGKVDLSRSIYNNLQKFVDGIKQKSIHTSIHDFRESQLYQNADAFYYFDPPYLVTTAPYNTQWGIEEEEALLQLLDKLHEDCKRFALSNVLLSNGKENSLLKEWSKRYNIHYLRRQYRNANYQKINITDTIEVLITNYE
jgi:DNA adenine methylase Dam